MNVHSSKASGRHFLTRRRHQKSRTGCITCKNKKVKCDEVKPSCHYCAHRSIQCIYATPRSTSPPPPPPPASNASNSQQILSSTPSNGPITATTTPAASTPSALIPTGLSPDYPLGPGGQWSLCDLELMHFYTVSTSLTFSNMPCRRYVWQSVVPQIAFSHDFLLNGLLALAALHLSRISPGRKESLLAIASAHHDISLPIFRSAVQDMSAHNHDACSAFGTLLTVYEWAATEHTGNLFFSIPQHPAESSTMEWVQLLRGSGSVVTRYYEEIGRGPMAPVMHWDHSAEVEAEMHPAEPVRFAALEKLWELDELAVSAAEAEALKEALKWLRIIYTIMTTPNSNNDPPSAALSWPVRVPEMYVVMARQRHPAALILLSHFCLLLNRVGDFWWIRGTSRTLLQGIHQTLGSEWESWIAWPLQDLVLCEFQQQSSLNSS